ncbi:MAG: hypothetical protein AAGH46_04075 [Bacteroidota bacterium]
MVYRTANYKIVVSCLAFLADILWKASYFLVFATVLATLAGSEQHRGCGLQVLTSDTPE